MRRSLKTGIVVPLLVTAGALSAPGCGGRAAARAVTSAQPPPIAEWEHPSRLSDAAPAVRLDRPGAPSSGKESAACEAGCPDAATGGPRGAAGRAGGVRVSLRPGMTLYSLARVYQVSL